MQEFLGFRFEIISNGRIKNYFLRYNAAGYLSFGFPPRSKHKLQFVYDYITKNHSLIHSNLMRLQAQQNSMHNYVQEYIQAHDNRLYIFQTHYDVVSLSIQDLEKLLFAKAKNMLDSCSRLMNLQYSSLHISYAKSYLGQCNSKNAIKIDYRVVLCEEHLLHYLVIHELAHIKHKNHSVAFWNEVAKYHPDYKKSRKQLKISVNKNTQILKYYNLLPKKLQ